MELLEEETRGRMRVLAAAAAPLWAGEAEITRSYFEGGNRSREGDLFWLRAQAFKETRHLRDLAPALQHEYWTTGALAVHPDGERAAEILAEEMKHFGLLAGLIRRLAGKEVVPDELHGLEEDRRLQALRADFRKRGGELEQAAVTFTEGGGGSMYAVLEGLDGSDFDRDVAAAFREIHTDEVIHGPMQIHRIAQHARNAEDWERCTQIAVSICRQRLQMRNEMFGRPLSELRIEEIEAGKIEPWPIPIEI